MAVIHNHPSPSSRSFVMRTFLLLLLLAYFVLVRADYGDPWPNPGSFSDKELLPKNGDRPFMVALNFLRSDPIWWLDNVFPEYAPILHYPSMPAMKYDRRLAGSAFWHATQLANFSSSSCSMPDPAEPACTNMSSCPELCCYRAEDCQNIDNTPANYFLQYGFRWNFTSAGGFAYGFAAGPQLTPNNLIEVVKNMYEQDPSRALECAPSDQNSTQKDLFRSAIWTEKHLLFGAGYAHSASSHFQNYWQFHTGFVDRDTTYIPDDNGIASAMYVELNSTMKGRL